MPLKYMIITAVFAVISGLAAIQGCEPKRQEPPQHITIAVSVQPLSAPVYIASEKGYFQQQGLQMDLQPFWTGSEALHAVIHGKAQFCTVAETPLMLAGLQKQKIYILATIADAENYIKIVARKDKGIAKPEDLEGKTIAIKKGTSSEYFLHAYLIFYGIPKGRVQVVDMELEKMARALAEGTIDAAASWYPYITAQQTQLGANSISLENPFIYKALWNIAAGQEFAKSHLETVTKLLRALIQAQRYIEERPEETRKIVARHVGADVPLDMFTYDIRLSQTLILSLEQQARWAIHEGLSSTGKMPDYLSLFYPEGMRAVAPESVLLSH